MRPGFVMLAHDGLDRAASVVRHLDAQGAPVAVHLDRRLPRQTARSFVDAVQSPRVTVSKRFRCEWGTWAIVRATLDTTRRLLAERPDLTHVVLISGSCLPLRPVADLAAFLARHPETDFIESVAAEHASWTRGGLDAERFSLFFPFAWKRERSVFDLAVAVQRRFGIRRQVPGGLELHIGSQWWCLTRDTVNRILEDRERPGYDRFFRLAWIPDEAYFQSLVRRHARRIESRSLTLSKFDFQGKPHVLYDDHLDLLRRSDCFFARKVWRGADRLYDVFLGREGTAANRIPPAPAIIDRYFQQALERRTRGRPGLYMAGRFPNPNWENGKTAAPYTVLIGAEALFQNVEAWIAKTTRAEVHGNLFAPDRAEFAGGSEMFRGGLSAGSALRDYNPEAFLANLVRGSGGRAQVFRFAPRDRGRIVGFIASDRNARILHVEGAWIIPLLMSGRPPGDLRNLAAEYQATEARHMETLSAPWANATLVRRTLCEAIEDPRSLVADLLGLIGEQTRPASLPVSTDLSGLPGFLQALRNEGFHPRAFAGLDHAFGADRLARRPADATGG